MVVSREQAQPLAIVPLIFEQLDNLTTLSQIVEAYPGLLECMLERQFSRSMPVSLSDAWSEETLSYAYTVLQIEEQRYCLTGFTLLSDRQKARGLDRNN